MPALTFLTTSLFLLRSTWISSADHCFRYIAFFLLSQFLCGAIVLYRDFRLKQLIESYLLFYVDGEKPAPYGFLLNILCASSFIWAKLGLLSSIVFDLSRFWLKKSGTAVLSSKHSFFCRGRVRGVAKRFSSDIFRRPTSSTGLGIDTCRLELERYRLSTFLFELFSPALDTSPIDD